MRYETIDSALFIHNRSRLIAKLKPNSLVILHSNDVMPTNADGTMPFKQNSDLIHLCGIDQEESVLVLFPDAANKKNCEILFLRETNETIAIWEGAKLSKEQATKVSGIENIQWISNFENHVHTLILQAEHVYLHSNEHLRAESSVQTRNARYIENFVKNYPLHKIERLSPLMNMIRPIKHQIEVDLIRKACGITRDGFLRVLKMIQPGVGEWEVEAEYAHEFIRQRSKGFAYSPIIGSGQNNTVLHYLENSNICKDGELLLMDVAAEYANWNSDMTRTVPVNGKFTERQKAVYDAVLRTLRYANTILRPGIKLPEYQEKIVEFIEKELISLGLINAEEARKQDDSKPLVKKYFMHGTSHHLGIDVHDVFTPNSPVEVGHVFTIEPGIYIGEEGFGVRLENDYYIGEEENIDLMADIPIEADEIEALMQNNKAIVNTK
jgi:Xaa-Pro aminopeptidase